MPSLEYLAGLFDGEGCVVSKARKGGSYQFGIQVGSTSKYMADIFQDQFGGKISERPAKGTKTNRKHMWIWVLSGIGRVNNFAEKMVDLCVVKKPQLEAILLARQTYDKLVPAKDKEGNSIGGLRLSKEDEYIRKLCFNKIRQCNQGLWDNLEELGHNVDYA